MAVVVVVVFLFGCYFSVTQFERNAFPYFELGGVVDISTYSFSTAFVCEHATCVSGIHTVFCVFFVVKSVFRVFSLLCFVSFLYTPKQNASVHTVLLLHVSFLSSFLPITQEAAFLGIFLESSDIAAVRSVDVALSVVFLRFEVRRIKPVHICESSI